MDELAGQVRPVGCVIEEETQSGQGAVHGRRIHAALGLMDLEAADVLGGGGAGRALEEPEGMLSTMSRLLTKGAFRQKSVTLIDSRQQQQGIAAMIARVPKRRNVKSGPGLGVTGAADVHERAKDFLTTAELVALLEAAKGDRHATRDHLLLMMTHSVTAGGSARP